MFKTESEQLMYGPLKTLIKSSYPDFLTRNLSNLPSVNKLNNLLKQTNLNNKPLKFINQDENLLFPELGYEERVYNHGLIAHRHTNWHDFFNALAWLKFPKAKSAINAKHFQEIKRQTSNLRSKKRDLLTLFDECGVIVFANENIKNLIQQHQWKELFINHRNSWLKGKIKVVTFGHAMYEKYLNPYIGMTAKALVINPIITNVDQYLASNLLNDVLLLCSKDLLPLPVLGIPGWYKSQKNNFYSNSNYFRGPNNKVVNTTM